jgi:hypothetical protein
MDASLHERQPLLQQDGINDTPVYPIIHMVKQDVIVRHSPHDLSGVRCSPPQLLSIISVLCTLSYFKIWTSDLSPDTPLTYEALTAPELTYTLVRPLEDKYIALQQQGNKSILFCILLNRVHFLRDQTLTTAPLSRTRAGECRSSV